MDILQNVYSIFLRNNRVTTDTRTLEKGDVFIALKGANFNGNKYARQAIDLGAIAVVVDEPPDFTDHRIFVVDDGLRFLQALANHHRRSLNIPFIGITGSNGKTTTKELIHAVLSQKFNTHATVGNYNNHIGVPLTLLQITPKTEIAIIEMGANHMREIAELCEIAEPSMGYITNFGKAHLEGFGSEENIVIGKSELYDFLRAHNGKAIVDKDDTRQMERSEGIHRFTFGNQSDADILVTDLGSGEELEIGFRGEIIHPIIQGKYNFKNIAAAIAIGSHFNVRPSRIKMAIEAYEPKMNRSEEVKTTDNRILLDAYNANPSSMSSSVSSFLNMNSELPKMLIIGDMFELGRSAGKEHQKIVDQIRENGMLEVILVGKLFSKTKYPREWHSFKTTEEISDWLNENRQRQKHILIKGSRGMKLESLTEKL